MTSPAGGGPTGMAKLIATEFVTLDGVMEAPGGETSHPHTGWVIPHHTPELERFKFQEIVDAGSHLLGRVTYESFAGAWPAYEGEMAERMNSMPKYVVSTTMTSAGWTNTTVLPSLDAVRELKASADGPILVAGSKTLLHSLLLAGMVDELRLNVFPVVLGSGFRWCPESPEPLGFRLEDVETLPKGVAVITYSKS
jgi:dihydrofolate reductase